MSPKWSSTFLTPFDILSICVSDYFRETPPLLACYICFFVWNMFRRTIVPHFHVSWYPIWSGEPILYSRFRVCGWNFSPSPGRPQNNINSPKTTPAILHFLRKFSPGRPLMNIIGKKIVPARYLLSFAPFLFSRGVRNRARCAVLCAVARWLSTPRPASRFQILLRSNIKY